MNATVISLLKAIFCVLAAILESFLRLIVPDRFFTRSIENEIVLTTGAGSGFGRALALHFAEQRCRIVCWDVNADANEETASMVRKLGVTVIAQMVDVSDADSIKKNEFELRTALNGEPIDILINNAGVNSLGSLTDLQLDEIERVLRINTLSQFFMVKTFLPGMLNVNKGHIVSMASMAGHFGMPNQSHYAASKHAVVGFTDALRIELRARNSDIKTTIICPGVSNTPMAKKIASTSTSAVRAFNGKRRVRLYTPDDIAAATVRAVRLGQMAVLFPEFGGALVVWAKHMLPTNAIDAIMDHLEADEDFRV